MLLYHYITHNEAVYLKKGNKIAIVQEILVSLQDELSVLKSKFATENNIINSQLLLNTYIFDLIIYICDCITQ